MDEDTRLAIDALYRKLNPLLEKEKNYKRMINELHEDAGDPPPFADIESITGSLSIAPDQYFGKGLVPSVRDYLKRKGRAAPTREIFDALKKGGFQFDGKDEKLHFRGFAIALSKRSESFTSIPNTDSYGLKEWYPEAKDKKKANGKSGASVHSAEDENQSAENDDEETQSLTTEETEG